MSYETLLSIADIQSRSTSTVLDGWSLMVGSRVRDAVARVGWTDIVGFDIFLLFKTIWSSWESFCIKSEEIPAYKVSLHIPSCFLPSLIARGIPFCCCEFSGSDIRYIIIFKGWREVKFWSTDFWGVRLKALGIFFNYHFDFCLHSIIPSLRILTTPRVNIFTF